MTIIFDNGKNIIMPFVDETLNLTTEEDLMPVILTMKMAISAARALRVESAAEKPCNQEG